MGRGPKMYTFCFALHRRMPTRQLGGLGSPSLQLSLSYRLASPLGTLYAVLSNQTVTPPWWGLPAIQARHGDGAEDSCSAKLDFVGRLRVYVLKVGALGGRKMGRAAYVMPDWACRMATLPCNLIKLTFKFALYFVTIFLTGLSLVIYEAYLARWMLNVFQRHFVPVMWPETVVWLFDRSQTNRILS